MESQVARPMMSTPPMVTALKWAKSSPMCHGIEPASPITRSSAYAATSVSAPGARPQTATGALMPGCGS